MVHDIPTFVPTQRSPLLARSAVINIEDDLLVLDDVFDDVNERMCGPIFKSWICLNDSAW